MAETERDFWRHYPDGFENGGRGPEPRMQMAIGGWKGKKMSSPREPLEGRKPCQPWFQPVKAIWDFWPLELYDNALVLFKPPNVWVICYNSNRRLIGPLMTKGNVEVWITCSGPGPSEFESWFSHLSVVWLWASYLYSLWLRFLIFKMGTHISQPTL